MRNCLEVLRVKLIPFSIIIALNQGQINSQDSQNIDV